MCLSKDVTGTLRNYHSPQFVTCFYTGCLSKDVTGALLLFFLLSFLPSHSVSVQRRDRSLFFLLFLFFDLCCIYTVCLSEDVTGHCPYLCSAQLRNSFFDLSQIRSFTFDLFLDNFSLFIAQCIYPKTWQVLCLLIQSRSLIIFLLVVYCFFLHASASFRFLLCFVSRVLFFSYLFWFHSVSVQRRDRCIATYSLYSGPFTDPLLFGCLSLFPLFFPFSPPFLA